MAILQSISKYMYKCTLHSKSFIFYISMTTFCVTMQATYKYMQKAEFVHFNTEQIGQAKTFK